MDIKELNINEVSADSLNIVEKDTKDLGGKKSVNFVPGADLLMNPNRQNEKGKSPTNIELSAIDDISLQDDKKSIKDARKNMFSDISAPALSGDNLEPIKLDINEVSDLPPASLDSNTTSDKGLSFGGILKGAVDKNAKLKQKMVLKPLMKFL